MTALTECCGRRLRLIRAWACLIAIFATFALQRPAAAADQGPVPDGAPVTVHLDQARVFKIPEKTATLVVGNPVIADASVQPGGIMVVTAKSYGVTNLVALDRSGNKLMEHPVQVLAPADNIVVVYRGVERESYTCIPNCQRRITLGDTTSYFNTTLTQTGTLNFLAQGGQR